MEVTLNHDDMTTIQIIGSITSANASELEAKTANEPGDAKGVIIDAEKLEFISSAGLRVLLAIKKRCGQKEFHIINVNDEVMNVFDVTGFSEIMNISRAKKKISVESCEKIGAGASGEVYRLDDETIIKLYYPHISKEEIKREKELAKKAFVMGVPTAISYDIVESDGRTGVVYELINSKTLTELIREDEDNLEKYVDMYADVCKQMHEIRADDVKLPSFKDINREDIPNITGITDEERDYLYEFLDMVPDRAECVHGDLNLNNIMVQNGECCLIDMGEFSTGLSMFDLSRILFSLYYASDKQQEYNNFYNLKTTTVDRILKLLLKKYFGAETLEDAVKNDPDAQWLFPLAWFRCCTSMLKGDRWPEAKREEALSLLREKLIPFVISHRQQ